MIRLSRISISQLIKTMLVLAVLPLLFPSAAAAQRRSNTEDETPVFREYRGVQIGMTTEEARKKLGSPKDKGDEQDFYVFNDKETAQIVYDKMHKVSVLSVDYMSGANEVPAPKAVFGGEVEAKADGSIYKLVRYKKAGYWVSYNRTRGNTPMISITIQRIE
jgi:hypothetical protein